MKKSNKTVKIMAVFLATIMLMTTFTACEENNKKTGSSAPNSVTATTKPSGTAQATVAQEATVTASSTVKPYDPFEHVRVGGSIYFGNYEQDNDTSNGKEKINWIVVEKKTNKVLLVSDKVLDCKQYNDKAGATDWEFCSLRKWLNDSFYDTAFSEEEKSKILTTRISTPDNPNFGTDGGEDTTDKVFILSADEASNYVGRSDVLRDVRGTDYAAANGLFFHFSEDSLSDFNFNVWSWLRTPGETYDCASKVISMTSDSGDGTLSGRMLFEETSSAYNEKNGVRPVIWVALDDTAKGDTPIASRTPEVKPTAKPIDTSVYVKERGPILMDSTYTKFALKSTGETYEVPEEMPLIKYWSIEMYDSKNEQFLIKTRRDPDIGSIISNIDLYVFVQGSFYKISEGTLVSKSDGDQVNVIRWVEDNGLGKSINVRSKWYNEVYIEAEGVTGVGAGKFTVPGGEIIPPQTENVLANVVKLS